MRKLFNKTAVGEDDKIPLFKFTEIMGRILNWGGETFPMEIDKFARLFMVPGSKSLISFTELEKSFYQKFKDLKDDGVYLQNKRENIYKFISYKLIL